MYDEKIPMHVIVVAFMMMGTIIGSSNAQSTSNVTAGSITNLTNGSTSLGDANNMSAIEGTIN
ncbi:MAG TPA: hypothetical protein VJ772_09995 [Nitrososphaeraceae archaeon]|nr:hypothetical protein [Nitrososphaeraceae archaeon]